MSNQNLPLLEAELTYKLRGIFIKISQEHGYLYKEKVYQGLLSHELKLANINFVEYPKIDIHHLGTGSVISNYYPDFLVENKIIIEIKAQQRILDTYINQLIRYLNVSKYEIGFLVNFGCPRVEVIRRIYTNNKKSFLTHG